MTALKAAQVDAYLARLDPDRAVALVYGADAGLVRERAQALVRQWVSDADDPFAVVRMDGDTLAGEPHLLVEEASTVPMFGGRRAIWVKAGARSIVPALEAVLKTPAPDCRVVVEAGELRPAAPLRALCEKAPGAVALPCYQDGARELTRLIDEEMRAAGVTIGREAREALIDLLGGDRAASRGEIRKLALYAGTGTQVELEDVVAVVADAAGLTLDGLADAAFAGRPGEAETQFARALQGGATPGAVMAALQRQVAQLHRARLSIDAGASPQGAVEAMRLHFSRKAAVETALRGWTAERLEAAMLRLADAAYDVRRMPNLGATLAQRALLNLALAARRRA